MNTIEEEVLLQEELAKHIDRGRLYCLRCKREVSRNDHCVLFNPGSREPELFLCQDCWTDPNTRFVHFLKAK